MKCLRALIEGLQVARAFVEGKKAAAASVQCDILGSSDIAIVMLLIDKVWPAKRLCIAAANVALDL